MSIVYVTNVLVGRNPAALTDPFELEVSFECLEPLQEDLEWRLIYVGDADDKSKDQELDSVALGPIQRGALKFIFVADAPDYTKIKKEDINGITIILLSGSYRHQEFVRVGWYLNNYFYEQCYIENPPEVDEMSLDIMLSKMQRIILAENPRVTRFNIDWDRPNPETAALMLIPEPSTSIWNKSINGLLPEGIEPPVVSAALDTRMTEETNENINQQHSNENINQQHSSLQFHSDCSYRNGNQYHMTDSSNRSFQPKINETDQKQEHISTYHYNNRQQSVPYNNSLHSNEQSQSLFNQYQFPCDSKPDHCQKDISTTIPEDTEMVG